MTTPIGALWRVVLAAAVSVFLLVMIFNVITQPVADTTRAYTADFTDASGLHEGADVRVHGVRVGKVGALRLKRVDGASLAEVAFTMEEKYSITPTSRVAIKFQALTGLRYVDVAGAADGNAATSITTLPTAMTQPSFDVTVLFNGLQPVLAALDPNQINTFTDNVASFLAGDGEGLGPMLESIRNLTSLVSNRERVISTIMSNLATLAHGIDGGSDEMIQLIELVRQPIESGMTVLDEFRKSQIYGPDFVAEALRLLDSAGIKPGIDIDDALDRAITNSYDFLEEVKRVPVVWENIGPPPVEGQPAPCSKGRAELPLPMDVLLNGRKVVLCNH